MTSGESDRRWFTLAVYLAAMYGALRLSATHFDETEWRAMAFVVGVALPLEGAMRLVLRHLARRRNEGRAHAALAPVLVLLAVVMQCGGRTRTTSRVEARSFEDLVAASSEAAWTR